MINFLNCPNTVFQNNYFSWSRSVRESCITENVRGTEAQAVLGQQEGNVAKIRAQIWAAWETGPQARAPLSGGGTGCEYPIWVCADVLGEEEDRLWGQQGGLESRALHLTSLLVKSLLCDTGINRESTS